MAVTRKDRAVVGEGAGPVELVAARPVIGVVALATDLTLEGDIRAVVPPRAAVCVTRIPFRNPTTPENLRATLPHLGAAAALLAPGAPLAAVYVACTSASVVLGAETVREAVAATRPGVPVVTPATAAAAALAALGVRRVAILAPYLPETAALVAAHVEEIGFDVVRAEALGLADDRDMARIAPRALIEAARRATPPEAEALFIPCTAVPAVAILPELEAATGRPVVTANAAALWQALGLAGLRPARPGLGRLFEIQAPPAQAA